jgi:homoaconitase/3-isopropylmalate dehydratase large subunit
LGIDSNLVQQWFKTKKFAETSADLSMEQVNQLLLWMAIQWATKQGILKIDHATNSFLKYVTNLTSNDFEELEAIKQWMQHLQGKSFKTIKA